MVKKEASSFSEEKEAKRLFPFVPRFPGRRGAKRMKVFWFFFSKKNILSYGFSRRRIVAAALRLPSPT
jgi:hypothetical protein